MKTNNNTAVLANPQTTAINIDEDTCRQVSDAILKKGPRVSHATYRLHVPAFVTPSGVIRYSNLPNVGVVKNPSKTITPETTRELTEEELDIQKEDELAAQWEEFKADPKNAAKIAFGLYGFKRKIRAEERARLQESIVAVSTDGTFEGYNKYNILVEYEGRREVLGGMVHPEGDRVSYFKGREITDAGIQLGLNQYDDPDNAIDNVIANSTPELVAYAKKTFEIPRPEDWVYDLGW